MCQIDYFTFVQQNEKGNRGPKCNKITKITIIFGGKVGYYNETTIFAKLIRCLLRYNQHWQASVSNTDMPLPVYIYGRMIVIAYLTHKKKDKESERARERQRDTERHRERSYVYIKIT